MKQETKARIRVVGRILFLVYLLALVYFLFFAEEYGRRNFFELDYRYNLVPFQEIRRFWIYREKVGFLAAFLNLAGNVIGFLPFGFIVPVMHKKMESFWKVSLLGFMFSLCVETIQLITKVGCFDVDDLMLNTLGAMIGCGAFLICNKFRIWSILQRYCAICAKKSRYGCGTLFSAGIWRIRSIASAYRSFNNSSVIKKSLSVSL